MNHILTEMLRKRVGSSFDNEATFSADEVEQIIAALWKATPPPLPHLMVTYTQAECDELCEIAERDGYEKAVQEIDQLTGGDGEYRYCLGMEDSDRHTPDAATMIRRIVDRFEVLNLLDDATKTGSDQPDDAPADHVVGVKPVTIDVLRNYFRAMDAGDVPDPVLALYSYLLMDGFISKVSASDEVRAALATATPEKQP